MEVEIEPDLQSLSGESFTCRSANTQDGARLDIKAYGFWQRRQEAYFDVRIFNPLAPSNLSRTSSTFNTHEREKRRKYEQRVREVEHGSFTPIVLSATGGMGKTAELMYKRLACMIADKRDQPYNKVMSWIRCTISYSLIRSAIMCLRGTRSRGTTINLEDPANLIVREGNISS